MTSTASTTSTPWAEEADGVAARLGVDPGRGLAPAEAAARLARHGPNQLEAAPPVPAWRKLLAQFQDPLVYLLLAAAAVSLAAWAIEGAVGVLFEVVVILGILVANALLGYAQEARAEQAVAALSRMAAPRATVLRDGEATEVPTTEVVPGDVLLLAEGSASAAEIGRASGRE